MVPVSEPFDERGALWTGVTIRRQSGSRAGRATERATERGNGSSDLRDRFPSFFADREPSSGNAEPQGPRCPAVEEFVALLRGTPAEADAVVDRLVEQGLPVETIHSELITPCARRLGVLWEEDLCNYFEVTVVVGTLQRMMRRLGRRFDVGHASDGVKGGSVFLSGIPGAQHTLGLTMIGDHFLRAGWMVSLGAPLEPAVGVDAVRRHSFDLVGLSLSRDDALGEARDYIAELRGASLNPSVCVVVGGRVFADRPELASAVGADAAAPDGDSALAVARTVL
jgi:methanogenic corrinoid protein MtbC1